jgi:hypothetical protein
MFSAIIVAAVLFAADPAAIPTPPRFLLANSIDGAGKLVYITHQSVTRSPPGPGIRPDGTSHRTAASVDLKGVAVTTADGRRISIDETRKRLKKPGPILMMSDGEKPSRAYLDAVAKDVLVFVFPGAAPVFTPPSWPVVD